MISDLLAAMQATGLTLRVEGDKLVARPQTAITPAIRTIIGHHRDDIVSFFVQPDSDHRSLAHDVEIVSSIAAQNSREQLITSLHRCLRRYSETLDPMWAEVAGMWADAFMNSIKKEAA